VKRQAAVKRQAIVTPPASMTRQAIVTPPASMTRQAVPKRGAVKDGAFARRRRRRVRMAAADASGLVAGYLLDIVFGDPRRWHPVAGFGRFAATLEKRLYADDQRAGARFAAIAVGAPVFAATAASLATRRRPVARAALVAAATWAVLGGTSLRREALAMAGELEFGDLDAARARVPNLCGRDPSTLDKDELARATVESVAENTSDAVVGPLVWGGLLGLPGLIGYRAVNTLDAMVGHRNERYQRFGTASARADDAANLVPSRLTAGLTMAGASWVEGSAARSAWIWFRDGDNHPSPNSGQCEAAMAGALGVQLGGRNVYSGRIEERPTLGDGPRPAPRDVERAARLSTVVGVSALAVAVGYRLARARRTKVRKARG
jgi:adenosylcobinamide-phosphate synthase